ncbi:MAG: winged helix-turn-helix transcriptional regulator [Proteobacteria bacterium]|nr:winged helix-turn-helix transcriptional regulator [Pseudomonadota bacterium]
MRIDVPPHDPFVYLMRPSARGKEASMPRKRSPALKGAPAAGARSTAKSLTVSLPELLVDGSDLKFRELVADLFAAAAGMLALRRALATSVGLSAAEYAILLATWHLQKKGAVGINTLAGQLHVAAANVTAEVGKLVKKGILDKQPHPKDSRAVLIRLTSDGTAILHELTPLLRRINDRLFSGNRARDMDAVANFLHHIAEETPNSIHLAKSFHPGTSVRRERQRKTVAKESRQ